ncbi:MAG: squalene/phytoene synthase family protein [Elusimicrobiaceae bacterium]|nr:squalene/phytoene synthase family protein [Elusimicrobiaceae bacterium]
MDLSTLLKENARTLYLSAKIMPRNQRQIFTVAYLLCRIADTIADIPLLPLKDRIYFVNNYPNLVKTQDKELLAKYLALNLQVDKKYEKEIILLENLPLCLDSYKNLNERAREDTLEVVTAVSNAMEWDLNYFADEDLTYLLKAVPSDKETIDYCVAMGGAPGVFWAKLLLNGKENNKFTKEAEKIGMALQITNILKDVASDIKIGRIYLPITDLTKHNLMPQDLHEKKNYKLFLPIVYKWLHFGLNNISVAPDFLKQIPFYKVFARAAVMWPVLWALETYHSILCSRNLLDIKYRPKFARKIIYKTMFLTPFFVWNNTIFRYIFNKKYKTIKALLPIK